MRVFLRPKRVDTTIGGLLLRTSPATVAGLVIAVVVDAVDRVAVWARSHIGVERLIGLAPTFTDGYSTAAVVLVCLIGRPEAAVEQRTPDAVLARPFSLSSMTMGKVLRGSDLAPKTAAAFRAAVIQAIAPDVNELSARALTFPDGKPVVVTVGNLPNPANNRESSEHSARRDPFGVGCHTAIISVSHAEEPCPMPEEHK